LKVQAEGGTASSAEAVSISLIVTELVINAFKHAFVGDRTAGFLVLPMRRLKQAGDLRFPTMELENRRAI
jgi:two-component sensor histidine kinase